MRKIRKMTVSKLGVTSKLVVFYYSLLFDVLGFLDTEKRFTHSDIRPSHLHQRCALLGHQVGYRRHVDAADSIRSASRRWTLRMPSQLRAQNQQSRPLKSCR